MRSVLVSMTVTPLYGPAQNTNRDVCVGRQVCPSARSRRARSRRTENNPPAIPRSTHRDAETDRRRSDRPDRPWNACAGEQGRLRGSETQVTSEHNPAGCRRPRLFSFEQIRADPRR
jgi:hypothetical protein